MSQEKPYGNPHRIYRDRENSVIAGVFAGLAYFFGARPVVIRIIAVIVCLAIPPLGCLIVLGYLYAAFNLPTQPEAVYESHEEEKFWRSVSESPADTFGSVRHTLRDLELRLRQLEAYVTSTEFDLDREIGRS